MKKLVLMVMGSLMAVAVFAADEKINQSEVETKQSIKQQKVKNDDSSTNRQGKEYTVNLTLVGIGFDAATAGVEVGYHLNSDTTVNLQYLNLRNFRNTDSEAYSDADRELWQDAGAGQVIQVSLKRFVANSFYFKPAFYHRTQKMVYSSTSKNGVITNSRQAEYTDVGANLTIGNQWQWKNFTMGCDWVGVSRSLTTAKLKGDATKGDLHSANILNFYMGTTF